MQPTPQPDAAPGKRFYDRGLFWLAVVAVLAAGALGVSFLAEDDATDAASAAAPSDITGFCRAAKDMSEVAMAELQIGQPATSYRAIQVNLATMEETAPASIAASIARVRESFDPVIAAAETPSNGDPEAMARVTALLDEQSSSIAEDGAQVSTYIVQNCGFDPADQSPATTEPPGIPGPAVSMVPGDPASEPSSDESTTTTVP